MRAALIIVAFVLAATQRADAYPQFQLSRDTTCTSCHLAPDGGGLLSENGLITAESIAWRDHNGGFMYGTFDTPEWIRLGGDVRLAGGFVQTRDPGSALYPMQAELAARVDLGAFSIQALGGLRRPQTGGSALHALWSREHYVQWQHSPDEGAGLYVRAGRLMPTFGLRLAEHIVYTQRYGGRPLYHEAYAIAGSYVDPRFEVHATAFASDRIASAAEHGDGGALYAEARIGVRAAVGVSGKYSNSDDQTRTFAGVTGKLYVPAAELTLLGEAQLIRQHIDVGDYKTNQIAAYVLGSRPLPAGLLLDVGIGHFTQDTRVDGLYRDCLDVNLHWFMTSHVEWIVTTRAERLGGGGPTGGYALLQLHYRL